MSVNTGGQPETGRMHDPEEFATELNSQQASSERRLRVLLGAGASQSAGLPDLEGLGRGVRDRTKPDFGSYVEELFNGRNLEQVLTRLRRIASLLEAGETFAKLSVSEAQALEKAMTEAIVGEIVAVQTSSNPYEGLATWVIHQVRHNPIEIFTLNYDTLFETALESIACAYFDGFVGVLEGAFRPDLVDGDRSQASFPAFIARIWKLHGSINWRVERTGAVNRIVRLGQPVVGEVAAIYPSEEKYEASRRVPFLVLHDRFRRAMDEPETLLLVTGYSFGDQHWNEIIYNAALRNPRSAIIVFCHRTIPNELADRASTVANLTVVSETEAIWSGLRAPWAGHDVPGVFEAGKLLLSDFPRLSTFMARGVSTRNLP
jgi:hypothetical protein